MKKTPTISSIDHLVITVKSLEATLQFYERVLMMTRKVESGRPAALLFGSQKINVHEASHTFDPKAAHPTPGSADFCLITEVSLDHWIKHLDAHAVAVELGPIDRTGARGAMTSLYFRDPDNNLVEVSRYQ